MPISPFKYISNRTLGRIEDAIAKNIDPRKGAATDFEKNKSRIIALIDKKIWTPLFGESLYKCRVDIKQDFVNKYYEASKKLGDEPKTARYFEVKVNDVDTLQYKLEVIDHKLKLSALDKEFCPYISDRTLAPDYETYDWCIARDHETYDWVAAGDYETCQGIYQDYEFPRQLNVEIHKTYIDSIEQQRKIDCATILQANIRRYHVLNYTPPLENEAKNDQKTQLDKEVQLADVPALRNSEGEIVGYRIAEETKSSYPYKAIPPLCTEGDSGTDKQVTHANSQCVALTLASSDAKTTTKDVIKIIQINNLEYMPLQFRIGTTRVMAIKLGNVQNGNLRDQISSKQYKYKYAHFRNLAKNLDTFHDLGYVQRDIKPGNMFFYKGNIVLTDHDIAGKVGSFTDDRHTPNYVPLAFQTFIKEKGDNQLRTEPINPYKKDQYALFISMMHAQFKETPQNGLFFNHPAKVKEFVCGLPCDKRKKNDLSDFLNDPVKNRLSGKLADFFSTE